MSRRTRILAAMALLGAQGVAVSAADAAFPGRNGKILYTEERPTGGRLFTADSAGRLKEVPRQGRYDGSQARLSPNGRWIVFQSYRNGNSELYRVRPNGRRLKRLTRTPNTQEVLPAWSPNGRRIAFQGGLRGSTEQDIYTIRANGEGRKRLTDADGSDGAPAWSPDGRRIAFQSNRLLSDGFDVYVMGKNGGNQRSVTRLQNDEGEPSWSPDGRRLVISSGLFDPIAGRVQDEIYTVRLDGSELLQLTTDAALDYTPSWSPNGRRIAFVSNRAGNFDVWTMDAVGGGNLRQVTRAPISETHVDWGRRAR